MTSGENLSAEPIPYAEPAIRISGFLRSENKKKNKIERELSIHHARGSAYDFINGLRETAFE